MIILIVDDEPSNLKLLRYLFESENHAVVEAANGEEALTKAREAQPDLIISDILMPVMDGFQLCRTWQKDPELQSIPFIFYTATYQTAGDEAFGLALGARAYLIKPMEPLAFMEQLRLVMLASAAGTLKPRPFIALDDQTFLEEYNQRLFRKLEQRDEVLARHTAALAESQASLRLKSLALEATANGIAITDQAGIVVWVNAAFTDLTGFALEELVGKSLQVLKSGKHELAFYKHLWSVIQSGRVWRGEIINRHRDGRLVTMGAAITPVRSQRGEITHFISIMQDYTERILLETEMRQAQKMQAVGRLAGGMAHDFNNMLSVILMNTEIILADARLSEPHRRQLLEIQQAGQRSADLTRQLLAFSRKQPASPKVLDLNQLVVENHKMAKRMVGEDVQLDFLPGPDLWPAFLDPSQVSQILANLVINARDAIAGQGQITLETGNMPLTQTRAMHSGHLAPGDYVRLTVRDTGCGIELGHLEHICEPFFTTKEAGKGTGLGLATVYGIVKQNQGGIEVHSLPGKGTTFTLYFPRYAGEGVEDEEPVGEASAPRGTETLLVVEDEPALLEVVKTSLAQLGYTVLAASSPLEALQASKSHGGIIQLLITDVMMPAMKGPELQSLIQSERPAVKTLFMSAYAGDSISQGGLLPEGTPFMQKPFKIIDMARKIRILLDE